MNYKISQIYLFNTIVAIGTRSKELIYVYFVCEWIICTAFILIFYMYFINMSDNINRKQRAGYFFSSFLVFWHLYFLNKKINYCIPARTTDVFQYWCSAIITFKQWQLYIKYLYRAQKGGKAGGFFFPQSSSVFMLVHWACVFYALKFIWNIK